VARTAIPTSVARNQSTASLTAMAMISSRKRDWGFSHPYQALFLLLIIARAVQLAVDWFLATEVGMAVRATGDNPRMIRSLGVDTRGTIMLGLMVANGLAAFSGALVAQHQRFADAGMGMGMIVVGAASVIIGGSLIRSP